MSSRRPWRTSRPLCPSPMCHPGFHILHHQLLQPLPLPTRLKSPRSSATTLSSRRHNLVEMILLRWMSTWLMLHKPWFRLHVAQTLQEVLVLAVDIQQEMLDIIEFRKAQGLPSNVEPVLGDVQDPRLPENSVDLILLVDAYHEFSWPLEMGIAMARALRPEGRLILIEYRGEDPSIPIKRLHKMTQRQARKEMEAVGLTWESTRNFLPQQHFMIFRRSTGSGSGPE